ncbi:MAG: prenyltransferase [Acidobacteriota bacterium]
MATLKAYLGVARAPFLALPPTLIAAGAAAAAYEGAFSWTRTVIALVGLVALHAAVNILNEVGDMRSGIDLATRPTPFSGGSKTLPSGAMSVGAARALGLACAAAGGAIGLWFLLKVGWILLPLLVIGAVAVLGYTNFLARAGLGEVFAGLGLGALPVWGTSLVQGGIPAPPSYAAALPAFFMTFNLLLLNEFPDEAADRAGGRRNLVNLLGRRAAAAVWALAALAVPLVILLAVARRTLPPACLAAVLPSLLLIKPLVWAFTSPEAPVPIPALGANVAWNLATNSVLAAALAVAVALE